MFIAHKDGCFTYAGRQLRCAVGRGGVIAAADKREGDGASPLGAWPMRRLLYRPDRGVAPVTRLPSAALRPDDGWCDESRDSNYNRPVRLPYAASHEDMWRRDGRYDLVVVLGYNDDPPTPGKGSAIFLHCATPDYRPTEGCVALASVDLLAVLSAASPGACLEIRAE